MNIAFHYYAVKTLARKAGFNETEAQKIATFSQYIDDYDPISERRYSNVPDEIESSTVYDIYVKGFNPMNFNPVTTGFFDSEDYAYISTPRGQKFTLSPFHFIPFNAANIVANDFQCYRCRVTGGGDGSFISTLLLDAKSDYINAVGKADVAAQDLALMRIGMYLHTFADTYAHQGFSGYNDNCNNAILKSAVHVGSGSDVTEVYRKAMDTWKQTLNSLLKDSKMKLGHMLVEHVPDLTDIKFTLEFYDTVGAETKKYTRNNTDEFLNASKEILNFLLDCRQLNPIADNVWQPFSEKLQMAFSADIFELSDPKAMTELSGVWLGIFGADFQNLSYSYDRNAQFDGIVKSYGTSKIKNNKLGSPFPEMTNEFYKFNMYADLVLTTIYGSGPRNK